MMIPMFEPMQPLLLLSSLVFSVFLAFSAHLSLKLLRVGDHRLRSILYTVPMLVPLVVYSTYLLPSILFLLRTPRLLPRRGLTMGDIAIEEAMQGARYLVPETLYLVGLTLGSFMLAFTYFFGSRTVCWLQGVWELAPHENPSLIGITRKLAEKAGIQMPRVGINEDLRPNAFTIGCGGKTMIVVTSGLLQKIDGAELEAVIAHEIAHIKNRDFNFMALVSTLKAISFFNPLVYLLSPAIKKEREFLADSIGSDLLEKPEALGLALKKIWGGSKTPSERALRHWISGLFIVSEIRQAKNVLTTHPTLESRLRNIEENTIREKVSRAQTLKVALVCAAITMVSMHAFGLAIQNIFPIGTVYGSFFAPERLRFRLGNLQASRPDLDFRPYLPAMKTDPRYYVNFSYAWLLGSIDVIVILAISLKLFFQIRERGGSTHNDVPNSF
ncbi:MAG: M48 family metallopeptidase [Thermoproteota archaeon]